MGKTKRTFDIGFKKKVVDLYLEGRLGCKAVGKEFGINHTTVLRWVRHYEAEGLKGLEEKRGKSREPNKEKYVSHSESSETKIKRLEAENEMLKKLLQM
ncbi:helix-turn-helix domain-containing protein [Priestia megaterium]|jgi:transposase|uniref:helix-turn-helix domain-containing protein n=1 Tax=Priestia megaterium TaxID=1404 RepID=UPI0010CD1E5F|nr:helix-turn-helix domain-containing protein [Priestia megaterium]MEC1072112.1 helix-turn-helix domain-containing protein [Priestia megaterium]MED3866743.1 helix-turn-helix domain-containing protein [Priestia megaterium]MED4100981.1 helix-turn-helix domain-containing protein [Priestia megaterium]MED4146278.1 helix-turn-helix domain-containing protein [Priestia megaterium]MED4169757.1 helix-turn-helix domain-containing protein [Priestia megaterium]